MDARYTVTQTMISKPVNEFTVFVDHMAVTSIRLYEIISETEVAHIAAGWTSLGWQPAPGTDKGAILGQMVFDRPEVCLIYTVTRDLE